MIDIVTMIAAFIAGLCLGAFFFGGLLWTIKRGLTSKHPALWFLGAWLVRISVVLATFYFVGGGQWQRIVMCTVGFLIARVIILRVTHSQAAKPSPNKAEVIDAP